MGELPSWLVSAIEWGFILVAVIPWTCFGILALDLFSHNVPLRERAGLALRDALAATGVAIMAANLLFGWGMGPGIRLLLFLLVLVSISVPSAIWLWLYATDRFR